MQAHRTVAGTFSRRAGGVAPERRFCVRQCAIPAKGFDALIENPYDTIEFDQALDDDITRLVEEVGSDGRLVVRAKGLPSKPLEKLLVTSLAKLTNFIPGGGIWMNTQRPEWNDANNALVGTGVSVVTLCYLTISALCRKLAGAKCREELFDLSRSYCLI